MPDIDWPLLHRNAKGLAEASDAAVKARLLAARVGLLARHGFASHAAALLPETRDAVLELEERLRAGAGSLSYAARRAQIHSQLAEALRLRGRYAEAARMLKLYVPQTEVEGSSEPELLVGRSDLAVCLLHLRDTRAASQERNDLHNALAKQMPMSASARGALLTNLAALEQLLGRPEAAARLSARAADAWSHYERYGADLRLALETSDLHSCWTATPRLSLVSRV